MRVRRSIRYGLIYCLTFALLAGWLAKDFFKNMENGVYDAHMRTHQLLVSDDIVLVLIDDYSVDKIGEWPFSSDLLIKLIDYMMSGKPSVIATTHMLPQFQQDASTKILIDLQKQIALLEKSESTENPQLDSALSAMRENANLVLGTVAQQQKLVQKFVDSKAVFMPVQLHPVSDEQNIDIFDGHTGKKFLIENKTNSIIDTDEQSYRFKLPVEEVRQIPHAFGHVNKILDIDDVVRQEKFLWPVNDDMVASLALRIYMKHKYDQEDLLHAASLGNNKIKIDNTVLEFPNNGKLFSRFYSGNRNELFKQYSFYDVFTESVSPMEFENKIVLFGLTAAGITPRVRVSTGQDLAPVEYLAQVTSSMLNDDWVRRGKNQRITELVIYLLMSVYVIFFARRFSILTNTLLTFIVGALLLIVEFGSLEFSYWYKLVTPMLFFFWCMGWMGLRHLKSSESSYLKLGLERDKTNVQLGLAFQSQGALDLAFEKFLECTPTKDLLSPLYNLGIEYERKRQFAKASTVYEYLSKIDNLHLDVAKRLEHASRMAMDSTQQMFDSGSRLASLLDSRSAVEKPRLGRYVIDREIGRGAMSVVYAGKDPTINRTVAIKVQSFSGDNAEMITKMRERFLTEAKTAGQLNHPDIITIYDIGEETDLIYIAMEYLHGDSLEGMAEAGVLDDETVLNISIRMARALEYAHQHKVIHRDIKPSNIIYDKQTNAMHLTDFGIARMQDAHLTQTGQVVGTPSYMSPEQITGKRVDPRTDLFSLGVTLYQLFTQQLPFQADTMATLLYKITVEDPVPVESLRPDLSPELVTIIHRLLQKEPADRFQSAESLANALEHCKNSLKNIT